MSDKKLTLQGPVEFEMQVSIIEDDEPERTGTVTIGMGKGKFPTEANQRARLEKFVKEEMPGGFRLMTKQEYFDMLMREITGSNERYALPGSKDWDA